MTLILQANLQKYTIDIIQFAPKTESETASVAWANFSLGGKLKFAYPLSYLPIKTEIMGSGEEETQQQCQSLNQKELDASISLLMETK